MNTSETTTRPSLQHEHFILDAELRSCLNSSEKKSITINLMQDLLAGLHMEKLSPLQIFDAADLRYPGWSFIQAITTSHISGHYFEESNEAPHIHMDIYSCTSFDWKTVMSIINQHLPLERWSANFVVRNMGVLSRNVMEIHGKGETSTLKKADVALQMA